MISSAISEKILSNIIAKLPTKDLEFGRGGRHYQKHGFTVLSLRYKIEICSVDIHDTELKLILTSDLYRAKINYEFPLSGPATLNKINSIIRMLLEVANKMMNIQDKFFKQAKNIL